MKPNKYGLTGKGIGVAVMDTGIFPHVDFDSRIAAFADWISHRPYPYDDNGHGTHVAGLLGGSGAAGRGKYRGVAPGCTIIALKVLDRNGNGKKKDVLSALDWILANKERYGIRIVNISIGSNEAGRALQDKLIEGVERVWDSGLVVVTAAGNMGPKPGSITAPGSSRKVITVGSSDMLTGAQRISGRGPTRNSITSCAPGNGRHPYAVKSGTSMSTPLIAGAAALALEKDPTLTNVEIKMLLKQSAEDLGYPRNLQGWGKFNLDIFLDNVYN